MARLHVIRKDSESHFGAFQQTWPYRGERQNGETVPGYTCAPCYPACVTGGRRRQTFLIMSSTPDITRVR